MRPSEACLKLLRHEVLRAISRAWAKTGKIDGVLDDAEAVLTPYFEDRNILRKVLGAGALTYEGSFLQRKASEPFTGRHFRQK